LIWGTRLVSDKLLLEYDPLAGITEYLHSDDGENFILERVMDVEPIVEMNKIAQSEWQGKRWGDGLQHVATIPLNILADLKAKGILDDQKAFFRWLDNPDNRLFRTKTGTLL
jgi:hypothetical protein